MKLYSWAKYMMMCGAVFSLLATPAMAADWPQFLGDEDARGISDGAAAVSGADLVLRWEKYTGSEWTDAPGTPVVVGEYVYYYSSQYLRKVDLATGEEVARVQVYGEPVNQFFVNIAYGEGKIFVPCQTNNMDDGTGVGGCFLRVFDADDLQQLYVTESIDDNGQMQSPVIYHDGYFTTGTYGKNGAYAGFTAADEDPTRGDEVKQAVWNISPESKRGFSFNGAVFVDDHCYFGHGSTLYVIEYASGEQRTFDIGEGYTIHSTITYSSETGRLYVAASHPDSGAAVQSYALGADGMPDADSALEWVSGTASGGTQSTPVIYNGRLYIGGGGGTLGSAETFHVVDAGTMQEIYSVPVLSKGSAGISTAYATADNGQKVYIYMVPYAPVDGASQLWIIEDSQGQKAAKYEVAEGIGKPEYCSQSVLVASDGSLLWYNDAGSLYCYENAVGDADDKSAADLADDNAAVMGGFKDVKAGDWFYSAVESACGAGLMNGVTDNTFEPNSPLSRAMLVTILYRLEGQPEVAAGTAFSDVAVGQWYSDAIGWASANGIVNGHGEGKFAPNDNVSREELAAILYRYAGHKGYDVMGIREYDDFPGISGWAAQAMQWANVTGLIGGNAEGLLEPQGKATRAEAAAILTRFIENIAE